MTYSLGRRLVEHDESFVADVSSPLLSEQSSLNQVLERIVLSPPFRLRTTSIE